MAVTFSNRTKSSVVHVTAANATITIAGNNSTSNVCIGSQNIHAATITRVWYGVGPSGVANIKRGSNLVYTAIGSGEHRFDGAPIVADKTGTLVVEFAGTANCFIMVELHKEGVLE